MTFSNRISQTLHDEHCTTVALLERVQHMLERHPRGNRPDPNDRAVAQLLTEISTALRWTSSVISRSRRGGFFPTSTRMAMMPSALTSPKSMRRCWDEFRKIGQDFCPRLIAHAQKEDMALLPLLDEAMDAETEARLYDEYVGNG
jgi:hypothetical protein